MKLDPKTVERLRAQGRIREMGGPRSSPSRPNLTAPEPGVPAVGRLGNFVSEFKLVFPIRTPQLNDLIRLKGNRFKGAYNAKKQAVSDQIRLSWQRQGSPRIKGAYIARWHFTRSDTRTDPDNVYTAGIKILLDALVWCGALENDSYRYHKSPTVIEWSHDKTMDAVQVEVRSANGEF